MGFLELFSQPETYVMLATLAGLEIVLGIDNIVFITILCGRLPPDKQPMARRLGLGLALISRLGLLFTLGWIMGLKAELFSIFGQSISGRDLILIFGGLFLLGKASHEIYHEVETPGHHDEESSHPKEGAEDGATAGKAARNTFGMVLVQIMFLDIVFSLDSVITAVGMVPHVSIMAIAMIIAVIVMIIGAGPVGDFVQQHASVRVLALAFLLLIGTLLMAEGFGQHVPRGYVYFAMGFALAIELFNMRRVARSKRLWLIEKRELARLDRDPLHREHSLKGYAKPK
jgi:predicted tellurium resistance membrane protein TerC